MKKKAVLMQQKVVFCYHRSTEKYNINFLKVKIEL